MEYTGVFQGGGMKGIAYIGAVCALEENNFKCIRAAGTSIGAVFASLLMCGYSGKELAYISKNIDFQSFLYMPNKRISSLIQDKGLYNSSIIEYELDRLYSYKGYKMVDELMNEETLLKVIATDATLKREIILPDALALYQIKPSDLTIARMVTLSLLYPGVFKPLKLGNSTIVDGGITNNFPTNVYPLKEYELGIAFQILNKPRKNDQSNYQYIKIDTSNIKTLKFRIDYSDKAKLFENGYISGMRFVEQFYRN